MAAAAAEVALSNREAAAAEGEVVVVRRAP